MELDAAVAVPGGARVQEKERIPLAHRIRFLDGVKEAGGISELGFELFLYFLAYFIAAILNSRPDRGVDVLGAGAKLVTHDAQAFLHDAFKGWPPAAMEGPNRPVPHIDQQYRKAVRGQGAQNNGGDRGNHALDPQRT